MDDLSATTQSEPSAPRRDHRVLVVDDDAANRQLLGYWLRQDGLGVVEAGSGAEGLHLAEEQVPDVVVLDARLPDIHGFEVCRRIRSSPRTAAVPVIQISAVDVSTHSRLTGLAAGADAYLTHPFEMGEFLAAVRSLMRLTDRAGVATKTAVSQLPGAGVVVDANWTVIVASDRAARLLGVGEAEALTGRRLAELLDGEAGPALRRLGDAGEDASVIVAPRSRAGEARSLRLEAGAASADGSFRPLALFDVSQEQAEQARNRELADRYAAVMSSAAAGIAVASLEGVIVDVNDALCTMQRLSREELIGTSPLALVAPEERERVGCMMRDLAEGRRAEIVEEVRGLRGDGSVIEVLVSSSVIPDATGRPRELMAVVNDMTDRNSLLRAVRRQRVQQASLAQLGRDIVRERSVEAVLNSMSTTVLQTIAPETFTIVSVQAPAAAMEVRHSAGAQSALLASSAGRRSAERALKSGRSEVVNDLSAASAALRRALSGTRVRSFALVPMSSSAARASCAVVEAADPDVFTPDVLEFLSAALQLAIAAGARCRAEDQVVHASMHDALTGLPNRARLQLLLDGAVRKGLSRGTAALFVDLDRFKAANDSMGHHAGDELLRLASRRLAATVRPTDTLARWGGDEFVILCENVSAGQAETIARRALRRLADPATIQGHAVTVSACVGVAHCVAGSARDALLVNADTAMLAAKQTGPGTVRLFDPLLRTEAASRSTLETDLPSALANGELFAVYQPVVRLRDGATVGGEALSRWLHPTRGVVMPDVFIPIAENSLAIRGVGEWVLNEAVRELGHWGASEPGCARHVAVNVSVRQLADPGFVATVRRAMRKHGVPPGGLVIELTESALMAEHDRLTRMVEQLCELGARIAIDDFGTGFSSLSRLGRIPLDYVKIDRSFVGRMLEDPIQHRLTRTIIDLARTLGAQTIAEGVETQETADELRALGCDLAQGYFWSPPVTTREFALWLMRSEAESAA